MLAFATLVVAVTHVPTHTDWRRFGYAAEREWVTPWNHVTLPAYYGSQAYEYEQWLIGRRDKSATPWRIDDELTLHRGRRACWRLLETMLNTDNPHTTRDDAACELAVLLGPVAYFDGEMPEPYPAWWSCLSAREE